MSSSLLWASPLDVSRGLDLLRSINHVSHWLAQFAARGSEMNSTSLIWHPPSSLTSSSNYLVGWIRGLSCIRIRNNYQPRLRYWRLMLRGWAKSVNPLVLLLVLVDIAVVAPVVLIKSGARQSWQIVSLDWTKRS
jgi:hypothetical protein